MENKKPEASMHGEIPQIIPVVPTVDVVVFPHMVVPLLILDEKIIKGVELALEGSKKVLLLAARQQAADYHGPIGIHDLYKVGTVGTIMRVMNLPEGGIKILIQGVCKGVVEEMLSEGELLQAHIKVVEKLVVDRGEVDKQLHNLLPVIERVASAGHMFSPDFQAILSQIEDPERVADFILSHLTLNVTQAQALLEQESLHKLLEGISLTLTGELEMSNVQEAIRSNTRDSINKSQREYYLREQLKAIQKELGEDNDNELDDIRNKIRALPMSEEAKIEAQKELKRLEKISAESMEATVIRSHLEWITSMPWGVFTKDIIDIARAKKILDDHHFGLDEIKERILDFLSMRALKDDCYTPILCLVGPPGVGKTSLAQAVSDSLGRKNFRISLGGVYDESEIRGHRRTYVGALPGRFVQAIKRSGSSNPVIIIDEIDKIGSSNRGDPSAALLEVLDPEQNSNFYDNYLGVHYDFSKVMFITTANDLATIPGPLRDRMEIIQLSGYTHEEKFEIAKRHLIPKAINNSGLNNRGFEVSDEIIHELIEGYTRESGVRELSRLIQKLCAKFARAYVESHAEIHFDKDHLIEYLGPRRAPIEVLIKKSKIGVTNGLAWTMYGGEILQVEAALAPGCGKLLLTGQLGDVMKESAQAAVTYVKAHADVFGIDQKLFTTSDLHIHLPAGAIPKDGPSAGIALLSSILSVFTRRAIDGDYAMTGELNLQGSVLPIGGLKEKILAAKQYGLSHVILPRLNEKDIVGLDKIAAGLDLIFVDSVDEVLQRVLLPQG